MLTERLRGCSSPAPPPSHLRRRAGRGNGAKGARLSPCPRAECILSARRQGVSVNNCKDDKAVFTIVYGHPPLDLCLGGLMG